MADSETKLPLTDPATGKALPLKAHPGYYPRYSTLGQKQFWDARTRSVVEERVNQIPPIRFFTPSELPLMTAIAERIMPQDDRLPEFRIPIVPRIDDRLATGRINGYRYEDMPSDGEAYRLALQAIDATSQSIHDVPFVQLDTLRQEFILKSIHDGKKLAREDIWAKVSIHRFWEMLVQDCVTAYYSHPWAWDEIGYGGPAYPRAYMRLEGGQPEPWEVNEKRYEWAAPADTISDHYDEASASGSQSHHSQGGTH
jgi:hypothetical protein